MVADHESRLLGRIIAKDRLIGKGLFELVEREWAGEKKSFGIRDPDSWVLKEFNFLREHFFIKRSSGTDKLIRA